MLGDKLADCGNEVTRHSHKSLARRIESRFVFGQGLALGLRLVMGEDSLDSLLVPSRRKPALCH